MLMNRISPHIALPGLLVPQVQQVPFERYLGNKTNMGSMGKEYAYITMVTNMNSESQVGQQWGSQLANQQYTLGQIQVPYYNIEAYVEYNVDEQAKFEELSNGVALPNFLENLAKQGINQRRHQIILHGFDGTADLSQGILANATTSNLPADSAGATTLTAYIPSELVKFLAQVIRNVMDTTYGMLRPTIIASSSRVINYLATAIIPLQDSQKDGGGIDSVSGLFNRVMGWLGVGNVEFIQDSTLEGTGANGADKLVFIAPGLDGQVQADEQSQNLVGSLNSITYNTWADYAEGLMRFDAPPDKGIYSAKYRMKMTPGVSLRSEAVRVVEIPYA